MRTLDARLCRGFLSRALERASESLSPRSGEDGKRGALRLAYLGVRTNGMLEELFFEDSKHLDFR